MTSAWIITLDADCIHVLYYYLLIRDRLPGSTSLVFLHCLMAPSSSERDKSQDVELDTTEKAQVSEAELVLGNGRTMQSFISR
jgi:hypothetical protein